MEVRLRKVDLSPNLRPNSLYGFASLLLVISAGAVPAVAERAVLECVARRVDNNIVTKTEDFTGPLRRIGISIVSGPPRSDREAEFSVARTVFREEGRAATCTMSFFSVYVSTETKTWSTAKATAWRR